MSQHILICWDYYFLSILLNFLFPIICQSCQSCQTHFDIEYYFLINPPFLVKNLLRMRAMAPSPVTLHAVPNESIAI